MTVSTTLRPSKSL